MTESAFRTVTPPFWAQSNRPNCTTKCAPAVKETSRTTLHSRWTMSSTSATRWTSLRRRLCLPSYIPIEVDILNREIHSLNRKWFLKQFFFVENPVDNSRHGTLRFPIECDAVVHGFAGYFETVLYKDVMLSINPATHSPGMFSWFPILFPLITPVSVKKVFAALITERDAPVVD